MPRPRVNRSLTAALWVNAALLGVIALSLVSRGGTGVPEFLPAAYAQNQAPIAGGGGVFIMPGQLSGNTWGVYLLDVDQQTLAVYTYRPGERQLSLLAARTYRYDRRLTNYNTGGGNAGPSPDEVRELIDRASRPPPTTPPAQSPAPGTQP